MHHRHTRHAFISYQILVMHIKVTQLPLNVSRHTGQRRILVAFDGKVRLGARIGGRHYRACANGHFDQHFPGVFLVARQSFQLQRTKTHTTGMSALLSCAHTEHTINIMTRLWRPDADTLCFTHQQDQYEVSVYHASCIDAPHSHHQSQPCVSLVCTYATSAMFYSP